MLQFIRKLFGRRETEEPGHIEPLPHPSPPLTEDAEAGYTDNYSRYIGISPDPFDLNRFLNAQAGVYPKALEEIRGGRKQSHWMWYILPQADGLGESWFTQKYAIKSREEAEAYYQNDTLRENLIEISEALLALPTDDPHDVFRAPDDLKLKSCMTLFLLASGNPLFTEVLGKYYGGEKDEYTVEWWEKAGQGNH